VNKAFVFQVRSGSSRLPNKMNIPFYNKKTIPQILIKKIQQYFPDYKIIIATTLSKKDDELAQNLSNLGAIVYRGSEDDVLQRFIEASEENEIELAIRVCADNPFIDTALIENLFSNWKNSYDYLAHKIGVNPSMKTSFGFFVEIVKVEALKKARNLTDDKLYIEHVTNYIYQNENTFKVKWVEAPQVISDNDYLRLTVDTKEDFTTAQEIYQKLNDQQSDFGYKDVISFVRKDVALQSKMLKEKTAKRNLK